MESALRDLNLTNDEVHRLGNALKDPKFLKLFDEYRNVLEDPEERRRCVEYFALNTEFLFTKLTV